MSHDEDVIESVYCLRSTGNTILLNQNATVVLHFLKHSYNYYISLFDLKFIFVISSLFNLVRASGLIT